MSTRKAFARGDEGEKVMLPHACVNLFTTTGQLLYWTGAVDGAFDPQRRPLFLPPAHRLATWRNLSSPNYSESK